MLTITLLVTLTLGTLGSLGSSLAAESQQPRVKQPVSTTIAMMPSPTINDSTTVALVFADHEERMTKAQAEREFKALQAKAATTALTTDEIKRYAALFHALTSLTSILDLSCYSRETLAQLAVSHPMEQAVCREKP